EEQDRRTVRHRQRRLHEHRARKKEGERAGDGEGFVIEVEPEGRREGDESDDRRHDAECDEADEWIVKQEIERFADQDVERIAGRMRMELQRLEMADSLREKKLVVLP